ncbi:MAG TPA: hypothetical protein VNK96_08690 [Fimbriimonadales bacterium]|nr:hypothetical protein [Fimbriimonadales bacterium]
MKEFKNTVTVRDFLSQKVTKKGQWVGALVIFFIAFLVRIPGITWGLPNELRNQSLHPDEGLIAAYALQNPYFRPGFYNYGSMYLTFLKLGVDLGTSYRWIPTSSKTPAWETAKNIYLTGRVISALAGAGTAAVVFLLLARISNVLGSIVGAIVLGLAPGFLVHSRFLTVDVFASFWVACALFFSFKAFSNNETTEDKTFRPVKTLTISALFAGFAAGTKYTTAVFLVAPLLSVFFLARKLLPVLGVLIIFAIGFLMATPGAILEPSLFFRDVNYEIRHAAEGHGLVFAGTSSGFFYHIGNLASAFGLFPLVIGVIGLIFIVYAWKRQCWLMFIISFLLYYFVIASAEVKFMRYTLPLLPFLAVSLGFTLGRFHEMGGRMRWLSAMILLLVGVSFASKNGPFTLTAFMMHTDPRDQAARWLLEKTREGKTVAFVTDPWFYSPPLFRDTNLPGAERRLSTMFEENPYAIRYIPPDGKRKDWDVRLITEIGPEYIVFSSFEFIDYDRLNQPDFVAFMEMLPKKYDLVALFWGSEPRIARVGSQEARINREKLRKIILERYPLEHDLMYIQPSICVLQKRPIP